jgi:hypothetical protein
MELLASARAAGSSQNLLQVNDPVDFFKPRNRSNEGMENP